MHVTTMSHIDEFRYVYVLLLTYFTSVQQTPIIAHMVTVHKRGQVTDQLSSCPLDHLHWC